MRIVLATDAWHPQVNGVVRSLSITVDQLRRRGHEVSLIEPSLFWTVACPTYGEIRLALSCGKRVGKILDRLGADAIHIATEGPIGWATRRWCLNHARPFTTSFHTRFPDYVSARTGIPNEWIWAVIRRFHSPAEKVFVGTEGLAAELQARGIQRTYHWPLGVDLEQFNPAVPPHAAMANLPRPIMLNVGRVAVEKNLEAFLSLEMRGSKVVVGGGPSLKILKKRYPEAHFLGPKHGSELASVYTAADVFVFPSRTDTFGLVNIEALACGLPIAAFPVPGPLEIVGSKGRGIHGGKWPIGALDDDLGTAIHRALRGDRVGAFREAKHYSWELCTERFLAGLCIGAGEDEGRMAA